MRVILVKVVGALLLITAAVCVDPAMDSEAEAAGVEPPAPSYKACEKLVCASKHNCIEYFIDKRTRICFAKNGQGLVQVDHSNCLGLIDHYCGGR